MGYKVKVQRPNGAQRPLFYPKTKRQIVNAGRQGGKTTNAASDDAKDFMKFKRILYASSSAYQTSGYWELIKYLLNDLIEDEVIEKKESPRVLIWRDNSNKIISYLEVRTAGTPDNLRGGTFDKVTLDEFQLMHEDVWNEIVQPMLFTTNGFARLIMTPPTKRGIRQSLASDKLHAVKRWKAAEKDPNWETVRFTSYDNPIMSKEAIQMMWDDPTVSMLTKRREIMAEIIDELPGAMFRREWIEKYRVPVKEAPKKEDYDRIVVGVDPGGGNDDTGIHIAGQKGEHTYLLLDATMSSVSPNAWATKSIEHYNFYKANLIVAEKNYGGKMVESTITSVNDTVPVSYVDASRGKDIRAEPVSARMEAGYVHVVGEMSALEDEMCTWEQGDRESPNRMDAMVWAVTELAVNTTPSTIFYF